MALIDEIREQPEVAARLLSEAGPEIAAICETIKAADPAHVVIAARGTSDHAAIYAQYALGVMAGMSVGLATPSVHSLVRRLAGLRSRAGHRHQPVRGVARRRGGHQRSSRAGRPHAGHHQHARL